MSEQDVEEEVVTEEVIEEAVVETDEQPGEAEAKARRMGWVPEDEYRGAPPKAGFKSAEKYISDTEEHVPLMRAQLRKQDRELARLQSTIKDLPGKLSSLEKQMYDRVTGELKAKQRAAVESGDVEEYDRVDTEIAKVSKSLEKPAEKPVFDDVVGAWTKDNSWFDTDEDLKAYATGIHSSTWDGSPDSLEANLAMVVERTRKAFPHKFENPNRSRPGAVEGGKGKVSVKGAKTYGDLPSEAKQMCDEFVTMGVTTKEKWAKEYYAGDQ